MPFAVFRQHQRKLLAVFAIMAMVAFVLSDTLSRWQNSGGVSNNDLVVADLFNKPVRMSDLALLKQERHRANTFMTFVSYAGREGSYFGGMTDAEMLDAMILKHEADRLEIPGTADFARRWIEKESLGAMNAALFETILARLDAKISGEELLIQMANQIRIRMAGEEVAVPAITPLDVFRSYRDQNERCSFKAVRFLVDEYAGKVGEPKDDEVRALFEKYKDVLPAPDSPTPGFTVPRKVRAEFVSINARDLARKIKDGLTEVKLKAYYETRKADFPADPGLPVDLFLGEPKLTPPRYLPFSEVRDGLTNALSAEQADDQVVEVFGRIRDEVLDKFSDKYQDAEANIADAKKEGRDTSAMVLPRPEDLAGVAKRDNLGHEVTPLLDHDQAEAYGRIARARTGSGRSSDSKDFADKLMESRTKLYEAFELNDILGDRYIVRKTADEPEHVTTLEEARPEVVHAWKVDRARAVARKAAEDYAAKLRAEGGTIKTLTVDTRPVISIESATKMKSGTPIPPQFPGQFQFQRGPATLAEFREIPAAGPALIDAIFALKPGQVAVQSDRPEASYYAIALEKRDPIRYAALMGPNGSMAGYWSETQMDVLRKGFAEGLARLRDQSGLKMTVNAVFLDPDKTSD